MGNSGSSKEGKAAAPLDVKAIFDKMDTNKNGRLDKEEIAKALKEMGKSQEDIKQQVDALPRSTVSFDEFKAFVEGNLGAISASPKRAPADAPAAPEAAQTEAAAPAAAAAEASPAEASPAAEAPADESGKKKAEKAGSPDNKKKNEGKGKSKGKDKGDSKGKGKGKDGKDGKYGKGKDWNAAQTGGPFWSGTGFRLNVKSLQDDVTEDKLKEMFAPFGTVVTAQIKLKDDGKSRGFGFVVMSTQEEGEKAIAGMNGKDFGGKSLVVGPAERRDGDAAAKGKDGQGGGKGTKGKDATIAHQQAVAHEYMQQYMQYQQYQQYCWAYYQHQQALASAQASKGTVYEGSLKSIHKGHGFIVCGATHGLYQRDIYVSKDMLPEGAKTYDRLKFTVELNEKGHPRASSCVPALSS